MCLPILAAAGTVMNVIGAKTSADAQSSAYEQQAKIAQANALYNQQQAANASYNGAQAESQIARKRAQITGTQRADYGASGIDPNSGSAIEVQNSSIMQSLADQIQARQNAANQVYGYQTESVSNQNLASSYNAASDNAQTIGKWNMATSLLNGATSLSGMYGQYKATGSNNNFWTSNWGTTANTAAPFSTGTSYASSALTPSISKYKYQYGNKNNWGYF